MHRNVSCKWKADVFENRALKRKFAPKNEEVAGGWRKLHREELR
jgi:hypothetical protein